MRRAGYVLSPYGVPLAARPVDVVNNATAAPITSGTTDDDGRWEFTLADDAQSYRVEIGLGDVSLQKVAQAPASIELEYLFVRYGVTFATAATVALPAGTTVDGVAFNQTALDARYVNVTGPETITGNLTVNGVMSATTVRQGATNVSLISHTHDGTYPFVAAGSYTGNNAVNRNIATGSTGAWRPRLVIIAAQSPTNIIDHVCLTLMYSGAGANTHGFNYDVGGNTTLWTNMQNRVAINVTSGFDVNKDGTNHEMGANKSDVVYGWVAYSG